MDRSEGHLSKGIFSLILMKPLKSKENLVSYIDGIMAHQEIEITWNNFAAASQLKFVAEGKWF